MYEFPFCEGLTVFGTTKLYARPSNTVEKILPLNNDISLSVG